MAEQLAENYHNTWGRKKKQELEAKGECVRPSPAQERLCLCLPQLRVCPRLDLTGRGAG